MRKKLNTKFILSVVFFLISFALVKVEDKRKAQKILGAQAQLRIGKESVQAWEEILEKRPDYLDGWIHLAIAYYQVGDFNKVQETLKKAKELDPINEIVLNLEKLLTR